VFWSEPSNLLLCRLLASGAFHAAAASAPSGPARRRAFLLALCHAFLRVGLHPMAAEHWRRHKAASPSMARALGALGAGFARGARTRSKGSVSLSPPLACRAAVLSCRLGCASAHHEAVPLLLLNPFPAFPAAGRRRSYCRRCPRA
jgi:hypothetical protein